MGTSSPPSASPPNGGLDGGPFAAPRVGAADSADPEQLGLWPTAADPTAVAALPGSGAGAATAARGAQRARRALTAAAVVGLGVTLLPAPARALFGIPGIPDLVIDPAAIAQIVNVLSTARNQLRTATNNLNAFVANTRRLTSPYAWRDPVSAANAVNALVASGQALSYSSAGLAAQLGTTFPGYSYNPGTAAAASRTQRERVLSTSMQQLMAAQATGVQLAQSIARLQTMKRQLSGAASAQQVAELNATIGVLQAEETALMRQQLLAQQSAQAVAQADVINRELQGAAAVQVLFTTPARDLTLNPPIRPRVEPSTYAF